MDHDAKAQLGEIYEKIDASLAKVIQTTQDDLYRWFFDKLSDKLSKDDLLQLMKDFMDEKREFPSRDKYMQAYREYLGQLGKRL